MDLFYGNSFFGGMPPFFLFFFLIVLGLIVFSFVGAAKNYHKNATSPILTQHAKVVSKRTDVTHSHHNTGNNHMHTSSRTHYYTTFETDAGQRFELVLSGKEFGLLAEGDVGELVYQGEWFKTFKRDIF